MTYTSEKIRQCSEQIISAGRELHARGWTPATSSNFSMRLDADHCAITVSGKHKGKLTESDIMVVDMAGRALDQRKPSAETLLHTQLYSGNNRIEAVLHTHSPGATVLSMQTTASVLQFQGYELLKAFSGISSHEQSVSVPIFENTQDIPALARQVEQWLDANPDCPAYLIKGHGAYTWGESMHVCERHLEALEFLVQCELQVLALNKNNENKAGTLE